MEANEWILFVAGCVVGLIIGIAIGQSISESEWRSETIERGYAEYDVATGQWDWKDK
jgi:hypothetical protein